MSKKEIYQKFCDKYPDIPIFSQPWYLDAVAGQDGWDILISMRGQEIAATMPIIFKKKFGLKISNTPLLSKYLGPYFPPTFRSQKHQSKLIPNLIEQLPKVDFFQQSLHPNLSDWLPFYWKGFKGTTFYTFIIDPLDDLEQVFQNFAPDYRNNKIPKAKNIIHIDTNRSIEDFYRVQEKTFDRQNMKMFLSLDHLKKYDAILKKHNAREIFFAIDDDNQIHSVNYLIWDKNTAYLLMAGDDTKLRNSGAGILLLWHTIQYVKNTLGLNRFDFLGSVIEPITRVRRQFGAVQTPYHFIEKHNSFLLKILHEWKKW